MTEHGPEEAPRSGSNEAAADRLFVESLLHRHFHPDATANSERLTRALRALDAGQSLASSTGPRSSPRSTLRRWAIAAGTLLTLGLIPIALSNSATAAISRSIRAMSRAIDFHYELEIESRRGITLAGEVWMRGTERATVRLGRGPLDLWIGEGRESGWIVPALPLAPVLLVEPGTVLQNLPTEPEPSLPFLGFTPLLERLEENAFDIEFGSDRRTIEARRSAASPPDAPTQVSLRITDSGVVRELVVRWQQGAPRPKQVRLRWLDETPVPESFYEHAAHHGGRRVVDRR